MKSKFSVYILLFVFISLESCKILKMPSKSESRVVPETFNNVNDTTNTGQLQWHKYFTDPNLISLIDTALFNNQELNIIMQEIKVSRNEVRARKGEYLPFGNVVAGAGAVRAGKNTFDGLAEEDLKANPGKAPKYIGDFGLAASFSWEMDIWKGLRNAKKAALLRYFATVEGRNFMVTNLIAEIADSYYELLALNNQLLIIKQNINIQENALRIVKQQKEAARVSQLAVNRFEAQLLNTQNLQYDIEQQMVETENNLNYLTGRFPKKVKLDVDAFNTNVFNEIAAGVPSQLLKNRPDIRQAEDQLTAANLDIQVARAYFYPNVRITATLGFQAFNPTVWFQPQSIFYNLLGDLMMPLINRNAIKANFLNANAKQVQAVFTYEQTILKAYVEVVNQLSGINNYSKSLDTKSKEVDILVQSIAISDNLFKSARADYLEILTTQREALETKLEQIEIKKKLLHAEVNMYKALGGGWN